MGMLADTSDISNPVSDTGPGDRSNPVRRTDGKGLKAYTGIWGRDQILHLLRRSLFGVSNNDYQYFSRLSLSESLDILLRQSPTPSPPVNDYNDNDFTDPDVPFGHTWINTAGGDDADAMADFRRSMSMKAWWVGLMLGQDRSLTEKMTLFWSNNLATQGNIVKEARYDYRYVALLRSHALGNYKTLAREIITAPAMLVYLNGNINTASAPNENFSRELQELFTVGKGPDSHYTQADVRAAARVLTGWKDAGTNGPGGVFIPEDHDTGDKILSSFYNNAVIKGRSGKDGATETDELVDVIFKQRETARNFSRKLYRWFIYYTIDADIEANVIGPLADILISNHFEVIPALRALLGSEHFFDSLSIGCHIKNPIDMLIGTCRQFQVVLPAADDIKTRYQVYCALIAQLKKLGMEPHEPLNVAGWPAYYQPPSYHEFWINSNSLPIRNSITDRLSSPNGWPVTSAFSLQLDLLRYTSQLSDPADLDKLIAETTALLSPNPFAASEIFFLKTILLSGQSDEKYWNKAWTSYKSDSADEGKSSIVRNRLNKYYAYIFQRVEYQLM